MASSSDGSRADEPSLQDIVFSCGICQATVRDVYATKDNNLGFHSGSGDDDGIVTKLWIAECSHIVCGKHLQGGAPPFHPKDAQPRAVCPQCMEKGDNSPKELYGIRGLAEGECDATIPSSWMDCPPIKLDGTTQGMEAVRFQYMNLARYATRVTKHWKDAMRRQQSIEAAYSEERRQRQHAQAESLKLKARIEQLEKVEAKLQKWEARKPVINHYLGVVDSMAKDMRAMRDHLSELGYSFPNKSYTFDGADHASEKERARGPREDGVHAHGDAFNSSSTAVATEHETSSSARKRKVSEYCPEEHDQGMTHALDASMRGASRDLMPPPLPKPKRLPPNLAPPVLSKVPPPRRTIDSRQKVQVYQDHLWQDSRQADRLAIPENRLTTSDSQQVLPFRPSPFRTHESNDRGQSRSLFVSRDQHESSGRRYGTMPVRSIVDADSWHSQQWLWPHPNNPESWHRHHPPSTRHISSSRSEEVSNIPSERRDRADARRPLQPVGPSYLNQQRQQDSGMQLDSGHSSPRETQPSVVSQHSPFFRREFAPGMRAARSPTQAGYAPSDSALALNTYRPTSSRQRDSRAPIRHLAAHGGERPNNLNHLPWSTAVHHQQNEPTPYGTAVPQSPRNSYGLIQRPDVHPRVARNATDRPPSTLQRSRISLPPSRSATTLAGSQERVLTQIPGVRGVRAPGTQHRNYNAGPLYEPGRDFLTSAAGVRRSVRR